MSRYSIHSRTCPGVRWRGRCVGTNLFSSLGLETARRPAWRARSGPWSWRRRPRAGAARPTPARAPSTTARPRTGLLYEQFVIAILFQTPYTIIPLHQFISFITSKVTWHIIDIASHAVTTKILTLTLNKLIFYFKKQINVPTWFLSLSW